MFALLPSCCDTSIQEGAPFYRCSSKNHARFPKQYLEEHLKDKSVGGRLVLTTNLEGVDLVAMGYKYNKRKVMHFIATAGAANTFDGDDPYMQRWADEYGNILCVRAIPRPALASEYFSHSPRVDNHNQSRHHDLALEELWQTQDCLFRLWTNFMGIHLIDCWKLCRFHLPSSHHLSKCSVVDFSDNLATALLKNRLPHDIDKRVVTPRRAAPAKRALADIGNTQSEQQHRRGQYHRQRVGKHMKTKQSRCKLFQAKER
jgi:hypothetical protein